MARGVFQIVATIAGNAIGGPIGAIIGSYLGSTIDSYVFPINTQGPRLGDLTVNLSAYGVPIPLFYGDGNRATGNVIWSSGLIERAEEDSASGKGGGDTVTTYSYSVRCAVLLASGTCRRIGKVWANGKLMFDAASLAVPPADATAWSATGGTDYPRNTVNAIAFYPGNFTQMPDPTIQSYKGVGNTCPYRGRCYVVLDIELADYGNRLPNLEFELAGFEADSLYQVVRDVCDRSQLAEDEISISQRLLGIPLLGYRISQAGSAYAAIAPLAQVFPIDIGESGGALRVTSREAAPLATIHAEELAAREDAGSAGTRFELADSGAIALPNQATLTYLDATRDYQTNAQIARRNAGFQSGAIVNASVPITLDNATARRAVDQILREPQIKRKSARFSYSRKFAFLRPGDCIVVQSGALSVPLRIASLTRGYNGVIDCSAVRADPYSAQGSAAASSAVVPSQVVADVGESDLYMFNAPILLPNETPDALNYAIGSADDGWRGAALFRSQDGGSTYARVASQSTRSNVGDVALAVPSGPADYFDELSTITVVLRYPTRTLSSTSVDNLLSGANACWIGSADGATGEVLQYLDATLTAPNTYQLSGLLRGRRGTEYAIAAHGINEVFVALTYGQTRSIGFSVSDWDIPRAYKAVSLMQEFSESTADFTVANVGEKARPRAPVFGSAARDGSNNLAAAVIPRVRGYAVTLGSGAVALDDPSDFEFDILIGSSVVRTLVATTPDFVYTAANQTTDGITPGNPVKFRAYQISATRGRGHYGEFTV